MSAAAELTRIEDLKAEFRLLFGNAPFGLAQCQSHGEVIYHNSALERMLGGSAHAFTLAEILNAQRYSETHRLISELLDGERDYFQTDTILPIASGRHVRWTIWRSPSGKGPADRVLALAQEVENTTAVDDRLRQAERLEAVGRLAGGVAHDFNNLLTGVLLYCDLLLASIEPLHRSRKYAQEIRKAGMQASGLVRQLLAVARPTNGPAAPLSLNDIADSMRNLLARLIGENIEVTFHLDPNLGLIKMDPTQAQQILLNLALNARDAMPTGGQITVTTSNCKVQVLGNAGSGNAPSLPCALFAVEDNGHGMDAATRTHLFEPFFTTKASKGTGLGLATVHSIVTRNGGLIHVDSEPGRGTRISVLLPLVREVSPESAYGNDFHPVNDGELPSSKEED